MKRLNLLPALFGLLLVTLLAGCAGNATKSAPSDVAASSTTSGLDISSDPKAVLERRVTDRWKLLIAGDASRAYTYLTPGYRTTVTEQQYGDWLRSRQIKWISGKYVDRDCASAEMCEVSVLVAVQTKLPGVPGVQETAAAVPEKWLLIDGVWYHLPKNAR